MNDHFYGLSLSITRTVEHVAHVEYYGETLYKRQTTYTATFAPSSDVRYAVMPGIHHPNQPSSVSGMGKTAAEALDNAVAALKEQYKEHPIFND